jgi:hypothetical protein
LSAHHQIKHAVLNPALRNVETVQPNTYYTVYEFLLLVATLLGLHTLDDSRGLEHVIWDLGSAVQRLEERGRTSGARLPLHRGEELLGKELDLIQLGDNNLSKVIIGISEGTVAMAVKLHHELGAVVAQDGVCSETVALEEPVGVTQVGGKEDADLVVVLAGKITKTAKGVGVTAVEERDVRGTKLVVYGGLTEYALEDGVEGSIVPSLAKEGAALGLELKAGDG